LKQLTYLVRLLDLYTICNPSTPYQPWYRPGH